ncbi:MAG: hypothetical protein LBG79_03015, partial [Spirochaetaceae bacterium]|nr:hypothetical protein [Spirochaetaceae bacterium]
PRLLNAPLSSYRLLRGGGGDKANANNFFFAIILHTLGNFALCNCRLLKCIYGREKALPHICNIIHKAGKGKGNF